MLTLDINFLNDAGYDPKLHPHAGKGKHGGQFVKKSVGGQTGRVEQGIPFGTGYGVNKKIHQVATGLGTTEEKVENIKKIAAGQANPGVASYANKVLAAMEKNLGYYKGDLGKAEPKIGGKGEAAKSGGEITSTVAGKEATQASTKKYTAANLPQPNANSPLQHKMFEVASGALKNPDNADTIVANIKSLAIGAYSKEYADKLVTELILNGTYSPKEQTSPPTPKSTPTPQPTSNKITSPRASAKATLERFAAAYDHSKHGGNLSSRLPTASMSFWNSVTSGQRAAVTHYTGSGYKSMNKALRDPENASKLIIDSVNAIDDLFEHEGAKVKEDIVVRRGMNASPIQLNKIIAAIKHGIPARFDQQGFISTSTASGFTGEVKLHVLLKKGASALSVKPVAGAGVKHEEEVLLPHGQSFEALAYEKIGHEHHLTVATV